MTNKKRGGLGRGIDALFTVYEETPSDHEIVEEISLSEIRPNPYQPRKVFDEGALQELANSIKQSGVFQPVILRRSSIQGYELIAGERRVRASELAGNTTIPAIVREIDEEAMIEIAIVENLQRENLNPLEEAEAYEVLMEKLDLTQAEVAKRVGKSRPYIANIIRLLSLPQEIKGYVTDKKLSMGQARTLLALKDKSRMTELAQRVIEEKLTVRQLEALIQQYNEEERSTPKIQEKKAESKPAHIVAIEQQMQEQFGTSASIKQKGERGKIEIEYLSQEDLTRILDILNIQI